MSKPSTLANFFEAQLIEAGLDEAGRGCLAGPVVAAAVIWPKDATLPLLNDSKKLNAKVREALEIQVKALAISYAVGIVNPEEIDEINILQASFLAMHRALDGLTSKPELLLVDGNRFKPYQDIPAECIVKGDGKYASIAAASILAKVHRDRLMTAHAQQYPGYAWERNAGYPTKQHRAAIQALGTTPLHRMSFRLLSPQQEIDFDK